MQQVQAVMTQFAEDLQAFRDRGVPDDDVLSVMTTTALWEGIRVVAGHLDLLRLTVDALVTNAATED
jgi:hypothetical protein